MSRSPRGFTLPELMVSLLVSMLVVAAALALMSAQQRAFRAGTDERQIQESGRVALDDMISNLRTAGFGIDPALAFDFGRQAFYPQPQAPAGQLASNPGYNCQGGPVTCRDSIAGSDEVVFRARNPRFGHYLTAVPTATTLTMNGPIGAGVLRAGQVLQVACQIGAYVWAYVTVDKDVPAEPAAVDVKVSLRAGNGAAFPLQNGFLADTCFQTVATIPATAVALETAAKVLKVDTFRYFVQVLGGRPYLMLDSGLDDPTAVTMVAPDVEDLQFTYVFPNAPAAAQRVGNTPGVRLADGNGIDLAPADGYPTFTTIFSDPARTNHHPANIRAVGVSATVRAPQNGGARFGDTSIAGNRTTLIGPDGNRRFVISTSVPTRNLDARAPYYPVWSTGGTTFNQGGG